MVAKLTTNAEARKWYDAFLAYHHSQVPATRTATDEPIIPWSRHYVESFSEQRNKFNGQQFALFELPAESKDPDPVLDKLRKLRQDSVEAERKRFPQPVVGSVRVSDPHRSKSKSKRRVPISNVQLSPAQMDCISFLHPNSSNNTPYVPPNQISRRLPTILGRGKECTRQRRTWSWKREKLQRPKTLW